MGRDRMQFTVANQIFSLSFDERGGSGTLVRHNDGLEASFSNYECLLLLLEGVIGRHAWAARSEEIVATLRGHCACV